MDSAWAGPQKPIPCGVGFLWLDVGEQLNLTMHAHIRCPIRPCGDPQSPHRGERVAARSIMGTSRQELELGTLFGIFSDRLELKLGTLFGLFSNRLELKLADWS